MKKISLCISFAIMAAILFTSCNNNTINKANDSVNSTKEISSNQSTAVVESSQPQDNLNITPSPNLKENKSSQTDSASKDYGSIGFDIESKESLLILNNSLSSENITILFGEPEQKSEAVVWGADGLEHQTWYFNSKGIEIDFVKDDSNAQFVYGIKIKSPCTLKTSRGIMIGSAKDEVLKAYEYEIDPKENDFTSSEIVVGTVYGGLIFTFEKDKVNSIFIGSAAE